MENLIFNAGLGYLIGLGLLGYVFLLYVIKKIGKKSGWPSWVINTIIILHFIVGLTGIFYVPIIYFKDYEGSTIDGIVFSVMLLVILYVTIQIAFRWDSILKKD